MIQEIITSQIAKVLEKKENYINEALEKRGLNLEKIDKSKLICISTGKKEHYYYNDMFLVSFGEVEVAYNTTLNSLTDTFKSAFHFDYSNNASLSIYEYFNLKQKFNSMPNKKCYIAGKISGLEFEEFSAKFAVAREDVRSLGMIPICPIELNKLTKDNHHYPWIYYMRKDIIQAMESECDAIYLQRDWKDSKGANVEHDLFKALGLEIIFQK